MAYLTWTLGGNNRNRILTMLWILGIDIALPILIAYFLAVLGLWYAIGKKYGKALQEWGLTTPKKEKKRE